MSIAGGAPVQDVGTSVPNRAAHGEAKNAEVKSHQFRT
jgi:hypothetical protein